MSTLRNIMTIARREFVVRARTRSFRVGTLVLWIGVFVFAFLPLIIQVIGRGSVQQVALYVAADNVAVDPAAALDAALNGSQAGQPGATNQVVRVDSLDAALSGVLNGKYSSALAIDRAGSADLTFTLYANNSGSGLSDVRDALVKQAAQGIAVADRLSRLGISPADQSVLFAPVAFSSQPADPSRPPANGADRLLGGGVSVLAFMMIVLYGTWIAMSVVEEKSSRVMEVILNAATPFQLLSGKVLGVGALALVQYVGILGAGLLAIFAQEPIGRLVLGEGGIGGQQVGLPSFNLVLLVLLGVYGVLGFALYATLYAAAASLISRQEEVQQAVMPMVLVATAGYLVGVYGSIGLLDVRSPVLMVLAQIPFFSPFMMLSRITAGEAQIWEIPLSIALLLITIVGALWVASRIYSAGVLMYGQRPSLLRIWRLVRSGA